MPLYRADQRMKARGVRSDARYVRFTTTGSTFSPVIEGPTGTVTWTCEETGATATGLTPTLNFGSSATRHVRMSVTGGSGLASVTTINLGFNSSDDAGRYGPGAGYNKAAENVAAVEDVNLCTGLVRFLAANGNLAGTLDFTGLSALEYIECFSADVEAVTLTGCTSLIRLCLEACNLTALNLTPVAGNLYDLRAAIQQGGTLALTVTGTLTHLYHLCLRGVDSSYTVTGMPTAAQLPAVEELWTWNTNQSGTLTVTSPVITSLQAYGNDYTAVDITGCDTLTSIDLSYSGNFDAADVNGILAEVESWGTSGGTLTLSHNVPPSSAGVADAAALTGRGWTVSVDTGGSGVDSDNFERANVTGIANVGNGWFAWNSADANIVDGNLVRPDTGAYRQILNPAASDLPADYSVTMTIPHATVGSFLGLTGRWASGTGARMLLAAGATDVTIGDADGWQSNNATITTDDGFPASWTADQDHVVTMHMSGTTITLEIDGQTVCHATVATNAAATGTAYGVCGEGQGRAWRSVGVTIP